MTGVNLTVSALGAAGDGLAVDETGARWIVPGALPGDVVSVQASREKNGLHFVERFERLRASPDRAESYCAVKQCGGCLLREWAASARWKQDELARVLKHAVAPIEADGKLGYRHRTRLHRKKGRTGFFAHGSHQIVTFDVCKVLHPELDARVQKLLPLLGPIEGEIEAVYSPDDGRFAVELPKGTDERAARALIPSVNGAIVVNGRRHGEPYVLLRHPMFSEPRFFLEPGVFSQANLGMNATLVRLVADRVPQGARVLELHAGAGNLTLGYAQKAAAVLASEWDEQAVLCLRRNVEAHGVRVLVKAAPDVQALSAGYDVLVVDPPRTGMKAVAEALAKGAQSFARIVYVSCDPQTLARDLKILSDRYAVREVVPVDMFFGTPHIEAVVLLESI